MSAPQKASPALVIGSYADREAGRLALQAPRRAGFRRTAAVHRLPTGQVRVENSGLSVAVAGLISATIGLAIAYFALVPLLGGVPDSVLVAAAVAIAALGSVAGALLSRWLAPGVGRATLDRFRRWVTTGETLVAVELESGKARGALSIVRGAGGTRPQTFIIRQHAEFASRIAGFERGERFQSDRLAQYAGRLAAQHAGALRMQRPRPLWDRLRDCERTIDAITLDLSQAVRLDQSVSIAAEWLLDNTSVIQRQLADIRRNLSHQLYDALPTLESGAHRGEPRAYDLAAELIAHTDADLIEQDLVDFLRAYQEVSPLSMDELWALPLLLRLALIENLCFLATSIDQQQHEFEWADFWANRLLVSARRDPDRLLAMLAELSAEHSEPSTVFADRLISQLQGEVLLLSPVLAWLELKWSAPVYEAIAVDERRNVLDQTTIANGIVSLRFLASIDWRDIFEQVSLVESVLRADPADVYRRMDFGTRDRYRHSVEDIARHSKATEVEVARAAIDAAGASDDGYRRHIGYYLVDSGRGEIESAVGYRATMPQGIRYAILRRPALAYLGAVGAASAAVLLATLALGITGDTLPPLATALLAVLMLLPASEVAIQTVNLFVTRMLRPQPPPKLSFQEAGIPDEWRTLVVVPTLLSSAASIRDDLARLEIRYLGNRDSNLRYALLADLTDASARETAGDSSLVSAAVKGIDALNKRYEGQTGCIFALFFRPRRWSETEQCWMGWERKRGKIEELNDWLLERGNSSPDALVPIAGDPARLKGIRFVITLDSDTQLPHGTARRLVGALAHPLNRPRYAPDGQRIVGGYTIIQPRVSPSLPSATATRFSRVFADTLGVDPYSQVVSDLYQDLAGEGSYYGKGIYDVETFHRVLGGRFPPSTLLSHDLLEGCYLRVGMATDVELYDTFPSEYGAENSRQHRWTRGDWQIVDWCFASVPGADGSSARNPIGPLNRWKLFDNLRRSLVPVSSTFLLLVAWLLYPGAAVAASLLVALGMLLPPALNLLLWLPAQPVLVLRSRRVWRNQSIVWLRTLIGLAFMPQQAMRAMDAIVRTLVRRFFSHRDLLEWQTFRTSTRVVRSVDPGVIRQLITIGLIAIAVTLMLVIADSAVLPAAAPFLLLWIAATALLFWLGEPYTHRAPLVLRNQDRLMLRRIARETWRYFDDLVGPQSNWLPPDNYQIAPRADLAQRTSPTNIGLWLLSTVAAGDLGYLTPEQVIERGEATFDAIDRLEQFEGHLLNWYSTQTLEPLYPRYASTVDSGNLISSLWTLAQAYRGMLRHPPISAEVLSGLADTLALVLVHEWGPSRKRKGVSAVRLGNIIVGLSRLFAVAPAESEEVVRRLRAAEAPIRGLAEALRLRAQGDQHPPGNRSGVPDDEGGTYWVTRLERQVSAWIQYVDRDKAAVAALDTRIVQLIERVERLADGVNMAFLYDRKRRLFTIGYNVSDRRPDTSYYDLLASESRVSSLVAIASDQVPAEHWFALGRPFGTAAGHRVLFSWSGTMFEYLMPLLVTRSYPHTLLYEAVREAVGLQIDYGGQQEVPWGVSESAFAAIDQNHIYQYQAFGVPGLGLKRGLGDDLVVAPYATLLALMVEPRAALNNLKRLGELGLRGDYGFYDAIDFTEQRRRSDGSGTVVENFMVHHQGMALLALDNTLNANIMPSRFHSDRRIQAVEPLLFEGTPVAPELVTATERSEPPPRMPRTTTSEPSVAYDAEFPATHLLGNGQYVAMVTAAGGGFSRWGEFDITRWRADTTLDANGSFIYIKDRDDSTSWSAAFQPVRRSSSRYGARFTPGRAAFERRDAGIGVATEIAVSPEDATEIRLVTLANYSSRRRRIEVTSYLELALATHAADQAHPAFSKLFVETESLPDLNALIARRKPRAPGEAGIFAAHALCLPSPRDGQSPAVEARGFETDRARFIGRGRGPEHPLALDGDLSGSVGPVLDPIFSLRATATLEPGARVQLAFVTCAGATHEEVVGLVEKHQALHVAQRVIEAAVTQGQAAARPMRVTPDDLLRYQQLAGPMLFPSAQLRASEAQLRRNRLGQRSLWQYGISGDLPIALVTIGDRRDLDVVEDALLAHAYWRLLGFRTDLVILDEESASYERPVQDGLRRTIQRLVPATPIDQPGGIFLRPADVISAEDQTLLFAVARVVLVAARGPLARQIAAGSEATDLPLPLTIARRPAEEPSARLPFLELPYFNGLGGFTPDGREYAIYLGPGSRTPAPWVNVLANPTFGAIVSESGAGFAWADNSQANRLSPWSNDPIRDPAGEALYIRDDDLGVYWSPTAAPIRENDPYRARHGQGYTLFEHNSHAIEQEVITFVPLDDAGGTPVRIQRVRLRNRSSRRRRLSVYAYTDWVLGPDREDTQAHIVTSWDIGIRALFARNGYSPEFGARVAFASASPSPTGFTADRAEFIGRNGSIARPAALRRQGLSGRDGAGLDPAAALHVVVEIDPDESADVSFMLGEVADAAEAQRIVERFRDPIRIDEALRETRATWDRLLDTIQVGTPDLSINFLLNRWLLYQTLSCRVWARSAFYQSGGALGFRDQLQDSLALLYTAPDIARRQILVAAARQFVEGDVQHWWHPHSGAGVRTRVSDDLLWLPYATARYVEVTGDHGMLDEPVPFLEGPALGDGQTESFFVPAVSLEVRPLLEHCRRAIARGDTSGSHGLPLIGSGDWNDGLSRVGEEGRGESVWLAWFLGDVLSSFATLIAGRGLDEEERRYRERASQIAAAAEEHAWDGNWYRRAYFDDGTPLGSAECAEARIDSVSQSWAVISGLADRDRAVQAMRAVDEALVKSDGADGGGLVLLFAPPFTGDTVDPGYIRGYPPGVRENGGQYTHAAIWVALAQARLGNGARAVEILRILNPVERARTPATTQRYRVEPYVVAADIYSLDGHFGQGGWTWYTGSAGWMYRVWIEEVLGLKVRGDALAIDPVIPPEWDGFTMRCRLRGATYDVRVENPEHVTRGVARVEVDGWHRPEGVIKLFGDSGSHTVTVWLGGTYPD